VASVTCSSWMRAPSLASTAWWRPSDQRRPLHDPAGELVDDLDLAVLDDVVDVALVEGLRLQRLDQMVDELRVSRVVEVLDLERALDLLDRLLHGRDRLPLLVVRVVGVDLLALLQIVAGHALHLAHDAGEVVVLLGRGLGLAGDDQRRPRLVDQDRVDLVHDRVRMAALDGRLQRDGHVVAQIVEAELGVGPVRDVRLVGDLALRERHHVLDVADRHAQALVDAAVPLRVALGQVVVDRDEVAAAAGERVQVEREARDERLALTGLHLGDVALVEDDAAHQLDVEDALVGFALARLPDGREGLEDELVERLPVLEPLSELGGLRPELGVRERLELGLDARDVRGLVAEPLQTAAFAEAQDLLELAEVGRGHAT
jgi:hypothetical protein